MAVAGCAGSAGFDRRDYGSCILVASNATVFRRWLVVVRWDASSSNRDPASRRTGMADRAFMPVHWNFNGIGAGRLFNAVGREIIRFAGTMTICAVIALAYGLSTQHQLGYWRDSRTLFSHALAVTRGNPLAHNNLGTALDQAGEVEQAIYQYRLALQLKPSFALAHNNLGTALDRQGKLLRRGEGVYCGIGN